MDYTNKLLKYFSADDSRSHIVVSPHAPPVARRGVEIDVAMDTVWDDNDVRDTIIGLKNIAEKTTLLHSAADENQLKLSEVFSLSISGTGRFRVSYLTQRGSLCFSMQRIPHIVESCDELDLEPDLVEKTLELLCGDAGGIVAIFGPSADANSKTAYALLKRVNSRHRKVILILEREITRLMRHDNSVVIQREIGSDCSGFDEGIRESLDLEPDIIFAGDLLMTDRLPSLIRAAETGASIIITLVAGDKDAFLHILQSICAEHYPVFGRKTREIIMVQPLGDNKIKAKLAANAQ